MPNIDPRFQAELLNMHKLVVEKHEKLVKKCGDREVVEAFYNAANSLAERMIDASSKESVSDCLASLIHRDLMIVRGMESDERGVAIASKVVRRLTEMLQAHWGVAANFNGTN